MLTNSECIYTLFIPRKVIFGRENWEKYIFIYTDLYQKIVLKKLSLPLSPFPLASGSEMGAEKTANMTVICSIYLNF